MPGKEGLDAQLVIQFLKNDITEVLQPDFELSYWGCGIQVKMNRFGCNGHFSRFLFGNHAKVGDGIVIDLLKIVQIPECLDVLLFQLAIFTISMGQRQQDTSVLAAVFLDIHAPIPP